MCILYRLLVSISIISLLIPLPGQAMMRDKQEEERAGAPATQQPTPLKKKEGEGDGKESSPDPLSSAGGLVKPILDQAEPAVTQKSATLVPLKPPYPHTMGKNGYITLSPTQKPNQDSPEYDLRTLLGLLNPGYQKDVPETHCFPRGDTFEPPETHRYPTDATVELKYAKGLPDTHRLPTDIPDFAWESLYLWGPKSGGQLQFPEKQDKSSKGFLSFRYVQDPKTHTLVAVYELDTHAAGIWRWGYVLTHIDSQSGLAGDVIRGFSTNGQEATLDIKSASLKKLALQPAERGVSFVEGGDYTY